MDTKQMKKRLRGERCPMVDERLKTIYWTTTGPETDAAIKNLYHSIFTPLRLALE